MKKVLSILLVAVLLASMTAIAASAAHSWWEPEMISAKDAIKMYNEANHTTIETKRYYFQMPDGLNGPVGDDEAEHPETFGKKAPSWYHEFTDADGVKRTSGYGMYWWDVEGAPNSQDSGEPWYTGGWIGYTVEKDSAPNVYYVDAPAAATTIVWNNGIDGGMDDTQAIYFLAAQTNNIGSEYYDPGESPLYPEGLDSFDNMIYIIDPDLVDVNPLSQKLACGGEWYFYYGDGCYGTNKDGAESVKDNCLNPDHNHDAPVFKLGDVNEDQVVDVMDATLTQKYCASLVQLSEAQKMAANVCGNGIENISVMDATRIQKFCAHLCNLDGSVPWVDPEA